MSCYLNFFFKLMNSPFECQISCSSFLICTSNKVMVLKSFCEHSDILLTNTSLYVF